MGWKKTTNDNGGSTNRRKQERVLRKAEERVILQSTEALRREMNLRLLTENETDRNDPWRDYLPPERVLYVESITVTDIRYPENGNREDDGKRVKNKL